jgi:predicted nucleic acid-binding protein
MRQAVIDASVIISWFLPDETDGAYEAILNNIDKVRVHVPSIFEYEIMNILLNAEKRKRIDRSAVERVLEIVSQYPIVIDSSTSIFRENIKFFEMARSCDLTAYDTAYLELAVRLNVPLITYDKLLLNAAKKFKIRTAI